MAHEREEHLPVDAQGLAWFQRQRTTVPDQTTDYFDRPELLEQLMPTGQRIALLRAPGGFGKTTLLAECCRQSALHGVATAWLCADADDHRADFENYLALALRQAGVPVPDLPEPDSGGPADRTGHLLHAVEAHGTPCLFALDELERLADPGAVDVLDRLIGQAPPNLRFALSCRELPATLDIVDPMLDGRAAMLTTDELRFSKAEIARFFDLALSQEQLASVTAESRGWPIALRIYRNARATCSRGTSQAVRDILGNWIESRLWRGLSTEDRTFLLDISLFEKIDAGLLDEDLGASDSRRRLQAMSQLAAFIDIPPGGASAPGLLHPLVREYCAKRQFREAPERFRAIHRRIALALERRDETVPAMRHAIDAGDAALAGRILEDAGGVRCWLRQGPPRAPEIGSFLTADAVRKHPRLALAHCVLLLLRGRAAEAKRGYEIAAAAIADITVGAPDDDDELRIDHRLAQAVFALHGHTPARDADTQGGAVELARLAQAPDLRPITRAALGFARCIHANLKADFDAALDGAQRARRWANDGRSHYLELHLDLELGSRAMAQGNVAAAAAHYASAQSTARTHFPDNPTPSLLANILARELELERNRLVHAAATGLRVRDTFAQPGNLFATYAAESATITELTRHALGVDMALTTLLEMSEHAQRNDLPALLRYLSAQRVSLLASAGRAAEAERMWRAEGLPAQADACLDLKAFGWREIEALACARLRLFAAQQAFGPGRLFAHHLLRTAEPLGLRRTVMRSLALAMSLEHHAGDLDAAMAHLTAFLHHFAATDYARPLMQESGVAATLLPRWFDAHPAHAANDAAQTLLLALGQAPQKASAIPTLTVRDIDVLRRLEQRDKQIAAELGITVDGVRYHVRRIFTKLGASSRQQAFERACASGLIPQRP